MRNLILSKCDGILSIVGGAGGGLAGWFEIYKTTFWSAVIFAVVGGVLGYWVGKFMQWLHKSIIKWWSNRKKDV